jgi:hypothetical protein
MYPLAAAAAAAAAFNAGDIFGVEAPAVRTDRAADAGAGTGGLLETGLRPGLLTAAVLVRDTEGFTGWASVLVFAEEGSAGS